MLKIGLTGGIGSGKTSVAQIFEVLGIPVYYADAEARRLMNEDPELRKNIIQNFGKEAYSGDFLDRNFLGKLVFEDKKKLAILNALVHPLTIQDGNAWMARQHTAYAIKEAALIFEGGVEKYLDYVIGVFAPKALRISRTMKRDHISEEEVLKRMGNQLDDAEKMKRCDFVIYNDEEKPVLKQVLELHETLTALSKKINL